MKLLTYNILDGGRDGESFARRQRVRAIVERERPDVLVLNECNLFELDGGRVLYAFERALGMRGVLATAASGFHVALFLRDAQILELELLREGFAHAAITAAVVLGGKELRVIGAHLNPYSPEQRVLECQRLSPYLREQPPCLLLGDLNAISPRDVAHASPERWPARYRLRHLREDGTLDTRALALLERAGMCDVHALLAGGQAAATRPSRGFAGGARPVQRLDYIFASASLAAHARAAGVCDDDEAQAASDHLPVWAEIAF